MPSCRADRGHPGVRGYSEPVQGLIAEARSRTGASAHAFRRRLQDLRRRRRRGSPSGPPGIRKVSGAQPKLLLRGVLTIHRQCLNHPCLRSRALVRDIDHVGLAICAARQIHGRPYGRSDARSSWRIRRIAARRIRAPQHLAPPRFVPVRFAPAHPGSSRSWRGVRRRVAVPRLSRDGVPHARVETPWPPAARGTSLAVRHRSADRMPSVRVEIVPVPPVP